MLVSNKLTTLSLVLALLFGTFEALAAPALGVTQTPQGLLFRIFSSKATRLELSLYNHATGADEVASYALSPENPGSHIWAVLISNQEIASKGLTQPLYYGYRAWGPNWSYDPNWRKGTTAGFVTDVDTQGNRFNPNKLLLDPYAREVSHDPLTAAMRDETIYLTGDTGRGLDSGRVAPKGLVLIPVVQSDPLKPTRPLRDEVIYEVHVRGFTANDPTIPVALRGTYRGAAMKAGYLKRLGVTAIEFLPVQETQNGQRTGEHTTRDVNYWGYMTLNYFAPDRYYSSDKSPGGPTAEFQAMAREFHKAGIKVYIDSVYNHTGEGGVGGSTPQIARVQSWRGLDNGTYYELAPDARYYMDYTGCGNSLNFANEVVRNMVIDSLAYWKNVLGVDGFRFDLASVLGNSDANGFDFDKMNPTNVLNRAVRELPVRAAEGGHGVELIAEPWAIGGGTYQLGNFPTGWAEWNGAYRDTIRKFLNKRGAESITPGMIANVLSGSANLFADDGRMPWDSINFMVAHDGFTLRDLFSYNQKQNNQPWPYGPSDGGEDNNNSWDQGGDSANQRRAARNAFTMLMMSAGTPMITGGDEFYRTLQGNNNAYNLDSVGSWLDWSNLATYQNFNLFARRMITFRRSHPALRRATFYTGRDSNGNSLKDITWLQAGGQEADDAYMASPSGFLAYRIDASEVPGETVNSIYIAVNGDDNAVRLKLPQPQPGRQWYRIADTAKWFEDQSNSCEELLIEKGNQMPPALLTSQDYGMSERSVLVLIEK